MTAEPVIAVFERLQGEICWGFQYSTQLNLSVSFGPPQMRIREPFAVTSELEVVQRIARKRNVTIKGAWWLWLHSSFWRIELDGKVAASYASSRKKRDETFLALEGQRLTSTTINSRTGRTRFHFDLGGVLDCRRYSQQEEAPLWTLYEPEGNVLSVFSDGTYAHHPGNLATDKAIRKPL